MAKTAIEGQLDTLTALVQKGFGAVSDDLASIKERMATTADIAELRLELHTFRSEAAAEVRSLHTDLAEINRRLDLLDRQFANLRGVTKEIDEIRDRVRDIEKHLGLVKKIAAYASAKMLGEFAGDLGASPLARRPGSRAPSPFADCGSRPFRRRSQARKANRCTIGRGLLR